VIVQADMEHPRRHPPVSPKPSIQPPPVSPRPSTRPARRSQSPDVLILSEVSGTDTVRESFKPPPPPPLSHVVCDTAGSETVRESFDRPSPSPPPSYDFIDNEHQSLISEQVNTAHVSCNFDIRAERQRVPGCQKLQLTA